MAAPEDVSAGGATSPAQGSPAPAAPAELTFSTPAVGAAAPAPAAPAVDTNLLLQELLNKFSIVETALADQKQRLDAVTAAQSEISAPGERDAETLRSRDADFIDPADYKGSVYGFDCEPPSWDQNEPHLYDLHGDPTLQKLASKRDRSRAAHDEYRVLACTTYYLSGTISVLDETFRSILDKREHSPDVYDRFNRISNTFAACESWYRKRLGYIRIKAGQGRPRAVCVAAAVQAADSPALRPEQTESRWVNIDTVGSTHDSMAFNVSDFSRRLKEEDLPADFFVVGDDAYVGTDQMVTPYPGKNLSKRLFFFQNMHYARR
jgi:hypothetical protein